MTGVQPEIIERPSQQAAARWERTGEQKVPYATNYGRWRDRFDQSSRAAVQSVLDAFNVKFYHVERARPDADGFTRAYAQRAKRLAV